MLNVRSLSNFRPIFLCVRNASANSNSKNIEKVKFNYEDALDLESQLTDDERMIRDSFRSYCQDKLMKRVIEANRKESKENFFGKKTPIRIFFSFQSFS